MIERKQLHAFFLRWQYKVFVKNINFCGKKVFREVPVKIQIYEENGQKHNVDNPKIKNVMQMCPF